MGNERIHNKYRNWDLGKRIDSVDVPDTVLDRIRQQLNPEQKEVLNEVKYIETVMKNIRK